jgi:hypothetical protein
MKGDYSEGLEMFRFDVRVNPIVWKLVLAGLMLTILGLILELMGEPSSIWFLLIMLGVLILFAGLIILQFAVWRDFQRSGLEIGVGALKGLVDGTGKLLHDESIRKEDRKREKKGV